MRNSQEDRSARDHSAARLNILRTFAEMNREKLDLHVLFEAAGNDPAERTKVLDEIEDLKNAGLVESRGGDFYALTDKGRTAAIVHDNSQPAVGIWARLGLPVVVLLLAFLFLLFSGRILHREVYKTAPAAPGAPTTQPTSPQ